MKVIGYDTSKLHSNNIVNAMLKSVDGEFLSIKDFKDNGIREADLVIISGILRGTGLVYKECIKQNRNFLFIDHAYFNKGYDYPTWMRITKNRHVFGPALTNRPSDRFAQFNAKYKLEKWRGGTGDYILILPPTHAISWLFNNHTWEEEIVAKIKSITNRPIKIRAKPENPIVDDFGNLVRMELNKTADIPLLDDIKSAYAVVAYNSNSVIECVKQGVPTICSENCATFPISFKIEDLITDKFLTEPNRQQLFNDLAYEQFNIDEMTAGLPYQLLK